MSNPENDASTLHDKESAFRKALHGADMGQMTDTAAHRLQAERQADLQGEIARINAVQTPGYAQSVFNQMQAMDSKDGRYPEIELHDGHLQLRSTQQILNDDGKADVRKVFGLPLTASDKEVALADDHVVAMWKRSLNPDWKGLSDGQVALKFAQAYQHNVPDAVPKILREEMGLPADASENQVWRRLLSDLQPDLKAALGIPGKVDAHFAEQYMSSGAGKERLLKFMSLPSNWTDLQLQNFIRGVTTRDSVEARFQES